MIFVFHADDTEGKISDGFDIGQRSIIHRSDKLLCLSLHENYTKLMSIKHVKAVGLNLCTLNP